MAKNWLIRTKQNQILGPVTRDKVLELLNSDSLQEDDELCTGNGYWFYIKEIELVQKYLHDNSPQSFNPVSEATPLRLGTAEEDSEQVCLPGQDDLEYPEMDDGEFESQVEGTLVSSLDDLKANSGESSKKIETTPVETKEEGAALPNDDDLAYPEMSLETEENKEKKEKKAYPPKKKTLRPKKPAKNKSNKFLVLVFIVSLLLLGAISFYYHKILGKSFSNIRTIIIKDVAAQTISSELIKKKRQMLVAVSV